MLDEQDKAPTRLELVQVIRDNTKALENLTTTFRNSIPLRIYLITIAVMLAGAFGLNRIVNLTPHILEATADNAVRP